MDKVIEYQTIQNQAIIDNLNINQVHATMQKITQFQKVIQSTLHQNHDFGVVPGSSKPTLLKPGAEKILMLLGLTSEYELIEKVQDYENGFFAFTVRCKLYKQDQLITEGLGHCNSKERKYQSEKVDPYTIANTCLKMAKKRAQIDATLTVASLSDIFTQDIEDMDLEGNSVTQISSMKREMKPASKSQIAYIQSMQKKLNINDEQLQSMLAKYNVDALEKLNSSEASQLITELQNIKIEGQ
ncbi:hypothetical protein [Caloramator proteoclasticus]|uniref:Uncharacterized protein n=1 Tax=Caloramator proteoclasticus DSM 10124 TaxID=1121262 RepID=A0A1M4ZH57_9CLOT|nr:hypothetical protein [Caloramator proteoclasticus]SHF17369.1 hypothetical protein SAMN02746091_01927 [Caloramator proteoclasticus DSM 10124]